MRAPSTFADGLETDDDRDEDEDHESADLGWPARVDAWIERDLERRAGDRLPEVQDLLRPLAHAETGGLPVDVWADAATRFRGRTTSTAELDRVVRRFGSYLVADRSGERFALRHETSREHFRSGWGRVTGARHLYAALVFRRAAYRARVIFRERLATLCFHAVLSGHADLAERLRRGPIAEAWSVPWRAGGPPAAVPLQSPETTWSGRPLRVDGSAAMRDAETLGLLAPEVRIAHPEAPPSGITAWT